MKWISNILPWGLLIKLKTWLTGCAKIQILWTEVLSTKSLFFVLNAAFWEHSLFACCWFPVEIVVWNQSFYPSNIQLNISQCSNWCFRCTWQGKPCNMTQHFSTILTDLGVCFIFNYQKPILSVLESGRLQKTSWYWQKWCHPNKT